jgi:hypothetical protein
MITKLKEKLSNTNKLTKLLFKYGFLFSYIIFTVGIYMLLVANSYEQTFLAHEIIRASLAVLCEFVISAIFFDFLNSSGK